jgi:hypothetical protein
MLCTLKGGFGSRNKKGYIVVKQTAGPTDILCVVGVNNVATEQRLRVWYWLCAEYSEGAADSRTGKVYIAFDIHGSLHRSMTK